MTDPVAPLIPWYAQRALDPDERRRVEEHLGSCADCRALLDLAREASAGLTDGGTDRLLKHVQAQLLAEFADDPDALDAEVERWVRTHLATCEPCAAALVAYRDSAPGAPLPSRETAARPSSPLERLWGLLASTMLRPAPALAYLAAVVILAVPMLRGVSEDSGEPPTAPRMISVRGELAFRGDEPAGSPLELTRPDGEGAVVLRLVPDLEAADLDDPDGVFELRLMAGDELVWSERRRGEHFASDGSLPVLLRTDRLDGDRTHTVLLVFSKPGDPLDGQTVFRRSFRIED